MNYLLVFLFILPTSIIIIWTALASGMISVLDRSIEKWAQVGDFFGGTLNPIFAYLALIALLYTIKLQLEALKMSKEELEATRKELTESRIAQQEQSKSLELQNKATKLQSFENTFFKLFDNFQIKYENLENDLLNAFNKRLPTPYFPKHNAYSDCAIEGLINEFDKNNKLKSYALLLEGILLYINKNEEKLDTLMYIMLLKTIIKNKLLLFFIAIYCYKQPLLKKVIEEYSFFDSFNIVGMHRKDEILLILSYLEDSAFSNNLDLLELINQKRNKIEELKE